MFLNNPLKILLTILQIIITFQSLKFNIPTLREKCFQADIYIPGNILVRYDITGLSSTYSESQVKEILHKTEVFIKNINGTIMTGRRLDNRKDKFVTHLKESGAYFICAYYKGTDFAKKLPNDVLMSLKIRTDYEYTRTDKFMNKKELDNFKEKIKIIKKNTFNTVKEELREIEEESKIEKSIYGSSSLFKKLTILQLIAILIIGVFHAYNFRKFLQGKFIN